MRLGFSLIVTLAALWLLWSGHYTDPLLLSLGAFSCMFVVIISLRMKIVDLEGHPIHISLRLFTYLPWLAKEIFWSNIDVAKHILSPKLSISPTLIEVEAFQKSELGQVIYANSITLTPGTVSVDISGGKVLVHALTQEAADGLVEGDMDRRAAILEGNKS